MKKLFAAILALGLIVAVSGTASAVDVKLSGQYYVVGVYDNNPNLGKDSYSSAYFFQRLRLEPVFQIAEGLSFNVRVDIMEGNWDSNRTKMVGNGAGVGTGGGADWERGWVTFKTGVGQFEVGYRPAGFFGTVFADTTGTAPRIQYTTKAGPMTFIALLQQNNEGSVNLGADTGFVDNDSTDYDLAAIYNFKGGSAGLLYVYKVDGTNKSAAGVKAKMHILEPYFKATFGPVYVEAELDYITGKITYEQDMWPGRVDTDRDGIGGYIMAKTNMGPATFGAQFGYSRGDDLDSVNKQENGLGGGWDWMPALIMLNSDLNKWGGTTRNAFEGGSKDNAQGFILYNIFGNYSVTPKFSVGGALTYAKRDKTAVGVDKKMGTEVDFTATYKIYDNLTYMVGAGYLFAGDWYKSVAPAMAATAEVDDDYILMNKLTLTF
jgi:hypothetical protein